jgi:hypothetical protein
MSGFGVSMPLHALWLACAVVDVARGGRERTRFDPLVMTFEIA